MPDAGGAAPVIACRASATTGTSGAGPVSPPELVHTVLTSVLSALPEPQRATAAVVLTADHYCVWTATRFTGRCRDATRRLRPSDSIRLEAAELLRAFSANTGWCGSPIILAGTDAHGPEAAEAVRALAGVRSPLVHCELWSEDGVPALGAPAESYPADPPPMRAVATLWARPS